MSALHVAQNHFPLIFASVLSPTHAKWNHSTAHASFSHAIISPNDTRLHTQYFGSFGSAGAARGCWTPTPGPSAIPGAPSPRRRLRLRTPRRLRLRSRLARRSRRRDPPRRTWEDDSLRGGLRGLLLRQGGVERAQVAIEPRDVLVHRDRTPAEPAPPSRPRAPRAASRPRGSSPASRRPGRRRGVALRARGGARGLGVAQGAQARVHRGRHPALQRGGVLVEVAQAREVRQEGGGDVCASRGRGAPRRSGGGGTSGSEGARTRVPGRRRARPVARRNMKCSSAVPNDRRVERWGRTVRVVQGRGDDPGLAAFDAFGIAAQVRRGPGGGRKGRAERAEPPTRVQLRRGERPRFENSSRAATGECKRRESKFRLRVRGAHANSQMIMIFERAEFCRN